MIAVAGAPPERTRRRGADLWWAVPGALAGAALFYIAHRGLIDDAYLTLSYVRNVAEHLHWGVIPTEESNTATSPLNVILLTLATWIGGVAGALRPLVGLGILTVALSAAMAVWAAQTARRINVSRAWSLAVLALVFANPFVNSSLALEVLPIAAFLTGLTAEAVHGRRIAFGVLAGLLVLTRLDLGIVVAAVYLATPALRRRFWVAPLTATGVVLPWLAFSWYHFGSAIPNTFVIKTLQRSFGDATFANGLWKIWQHGTRLPLALVLVPAGIGVLTVVCMLAMGLRRRLRVELWPFVGLGLGGAAYFGLYCLLGVPPYHWYYVGSTVALGLTGVFGLALLLQRARLGGRGVVRLGAPAVTAAVLAVLAVVSFGGRLVPWTHPVIFGNWALPEEYLAIGAAVAERVGDATVAAPPEIGTVAFACDCSVVDVFSDPGIALPLIEQRIREAGPVVRLLLEANYSRLDRAQQPRPAEYRLVWTQGPVPAGVPSWSTNSPWTGPATVYLEPMPRPGRAA
jgi:hypothetical protein